MKGCLTFLLPAPPASSPPACKPFLPKLRPCNSSNTFISKSEFVLGQCSRATASLFRPNWSGKISTKKLTAQFRLADLQGRLGGVGWSWKIYKNLCSRAWKTYSTGWLLRKKLVSDKDKLVTISCLELFKIYFNTLFIFKETSSAVRIVHCLRNKCLLNMQNFQNTRVRVSFSFKYNAIDRGSFNKLSFRMLYIE